MQKNVVFIINVGITLTNQLLPSKMNIIIISCFHDVNILLFMLHAETLSSVYALSGKGGGGEVNSEHKAQIVPPRCLSMITMSHSFALRWALINSNFTF